MQVDFSLIDLFKRVFGTSGDAFDPKFGNVQGDQPSTRIGTGASGSPYYANDDVLGREYYLPITVTYLDGHGKNVKWNLPYPVISISSRKTIIETPLTERRGTVKELINIQDYMISIKGFIIAGTNEFPEDDVTTMRDLYEQNRAINIANPVTDIFLLRPDRGGSDQVVIKELRFPEVVGVKNVRPYMLELVSDEPFTLEDITE